MVDILIYLLVFLILAGAFWYVINKMPMEGTVKIWIICIFVVIAAILLINLLMGFTSGGGLNMRLRG